MGRCLLLGYLDLVAGAAVVFIKADLNHRQSTQRIWILREVFNKTTVQLLIGSLHASLRMLDLIQD